MVEITLTSEITVKPIQEMGGDHMVVAAAKVSTSGQDALYYATPMAAEESAGLIAYLIKHRHGTPFEHGALTFFVHAPIFVFREWHRHRVGFSYNEMSARYSEMPPVFWVPRPDRAMVPVDGFKSARPQFGPADTELHTMTLRVLRSSYEESWATYQAMLESKIAREVARAVLPVGIYSSCWVTCNPRSLMHFLSLRTRDEAATFPSYPQAEIEEAARAAEQVFAAGWPLTHAAFVKHGRVAP